MIRFWLTLTLLLSMVIILLVILAISFGMSKPIAPELTPFGYCTGIPCWLNIDIETDNFNAVDSTLRAHGYTIASVYRSSGAPCDVVISTINSGSDVIALLQLVDCRGLLLGDLIGIFGLPDRVWVTGFCDWGLGYSPHMIVYVEGQISYDRGHVEMLPRSRVMEIEFLGTPYTNYEAARWHGFVPLWRYRQLEPTAPLSTPACR
jgi:hypothetical protein